MEEKAVTQDTYERLYKALLSLPKRSQDLIITKYGLESDEEKTFSETGDVLQISKHMATHTHKKERVPCDEGTLFLFLWNKSSLFTYIHYIHHSSTIVSISYFFWDMCIMLHCIQSQCHQMKSFSQGIFIFI